MLKGKHKSGGFTNASIVAPVKGKPHICIRQGRWRVSASIKPHWRTQDRFARAHDHARIMNIDQGRSYGT